jgi:hypothetical protein
MIKAGIIRAFANDDMNSYISNIFMFHNGY